MADTRIDPLGAFNFYLTLIDSSNLLGTLVTAAINYAVAGFSECAGLDANLELMEYREGGVNDYVHKFPTRATYGNITLKRGMTALGDDLWTWHQGFVQGAGKRKDGLIVLLNEARVPSKLWKFKRGIPIRWTGPALNATQNSVAIETLEIGHEGLLLEVGA
jgi:phage tail-like protein